MRGSTAVLRSVVEMVETFKCCTDLDETMFDALNQALIPLRLVLLQRKEEVLASCPAAAESGERGNCLDPKNPGYLFDHARTPALLITSLIVRIDALEEAVKQLQADRRSKLGYSG